MKQKYGRALARLVITAMVVIGLLPAAARAETAAENRFVFTVEAGGNLIVEPEYISYTPGQTLGEALEGSRHNLAISGGFVTEINGVGGNFTRSDQNGGHDLGVQASTITHFCFSERSSADSKPSAGLLHLMTAMADYREKDADVKRYAKAAFEDAKGVFVGITGENAEILALALEEKIQKYEKIQASVPYTIRFTDGTKLFQNAEGFYPGITIQVENDYGKVWMDENGDGQLLLPADLYTFTIRYNGLSVSGRLTVSGDGDLVAELPQEQWLLLDEFRISGSYDNYGYSSFTDQEFTVGTWENRTVMVPVPDTYSGGMYAFVTYDEKQFENKDKPTMTAVYSMQNAAQSSMNEDVPLGSKRKGVNAVLAQGSQENTIIYRVSTQWEGRTYTQDYTVNFIRIPSLTGITLRGLDERGKVTDQAPQEPFTPWVDQYTYKVLDTLNEVTISAEAFREEYEIRINGAVPQNGVAAVPIPEEETQVRVEVTWKDLTHTYALTIQPGRGRNLTIVTHRDVELELKNENGVVLDYVATVENTSQPQKKYRYVLVEGVTYTYVATYQDYYHCTDTIELSNKSQIEIDFQGMENWLQELAFGLTTNASGNKGTLALNTPFQPDVHRYEVSAVDTENNAFVWLTTQKLGKITVQALYRQLDHNMSNHGKNAVVNVPSGKSTGTKLNYLIMDENPICNDLTIRLSRDIDGVLHYQDYVVTFNRSLTLADMTARADGNKVMLQYGDEGLNFQPGQKEYNVKVSMAAKTLELSFARYTENTSCDEQEVGYRVKVDGVDVTEAGCGEIPLSGTIDTQVVTITVENDKAPQGTGTYTLNILKSPPVKTKFDYTPGEALLNIRQIQSGERLWPDGEGYYELCEGYSYDYALTQYGWVSRSGTLTVTQNAANELVIEDGLEQYPVRGEEGAATAAIGWELEKAPDSNLKNLSYRWPNFRGNDDNNAVTGDPIPVDAEDGTLYWANKLGEGYDADAVGSPILVDGDIITYAGSNIFRIDTMTGEIRQTGEMDHKSSFSITPPTYWNGMVFVALSDGCVQAFNAETLESLWIYRDPLGGQPNCPITVVDGYLYTGFWKSESSDARFVCLSVTDEDPDEPKEEKAASWFYTAKGGFYWAGAYVGNGYVLVGTDDGTGLCDSPTSSLLLMDAKTGAVLDSWDHLDGDIRSTVVHSGGAHYFTSKGGTFYCVKVDGGKLTEGWQLKLQNGSDKQPPMSTSSPVVYNGRAYVGVSGASQFGQYSGHNITVIDLASQSIAYRVPTQGYPQTSGLLTHAYEGGVYVYFFDNYTPGKLRVIYDTPDTWEAGRVTEETYLDNGMEQKVNTAYALFTPSGDEAQYAICSPVTDEWGTVYFKNDSARLMAFGSAIDHLEVKNLPAKTTYIAGEKFDPKGMTVLAHYANGRSRDITPYISYSAEALTAADNHNFTVSFEIVMYHNQEDGQGMLAGETTQTPTAIVDITVNEGTPGDVNGDGNIDEKDAQLVLDYEAGKQLEMPISGVVADVSGDGIINSDDAVLILLYQEGKLTQFPVEGKAEQDQTQTGDPQPDPGT